MIKTHKPTIIRLIYWTGAAAVGFLAVQYAKLIDLAQNLYLDYYRDHPIAALITTPPFFVLATFLVVKFAPQASGSGIPQVLRTIESANEPQIWQSKLVSVRTAAIKVLSSVVGILGGASIGREGPTVQIASSTFAAFGRLALRWQWVPKLDFQALVVGGAAAGVAAAFNTPLAGITFALEEITEGTFGPFKRMAITSVVIAGITAQALLGDYLYFGHPLIQGVGISTLPLALLIGLVAGLAGGVFAWMLANQPRWLSQLPWWLKAFVCGLVCSGIAAFTGGKTTGSGYEITRQFMDSTNGTLPILFPFEKFITTLASYYSGMAGGIFSPSLSIGAGIGTTVASLFQFSEFKVAALLGMAAFFSGAIQAPLTGVIIVMEMTDEHTLIIPLLVAALLAQKIGQFCLKEPLYRHLSKKLPKLSE